MNGRIRIGTAITAAVAMLVLAGSAVAQSGADLARGDALNKRYHLGQYSPAAQAGPKPAAMTAQQWQAELARSDALNERYGLGSYADPADNPVVTTSGPEGLVSVAANGFDWSSAAIGAGTAIGLALLATGTAVAVRQSRRSPLSTPS
jgi:hypothetical protein